MQFKRQGKQIYLLRSVYDPVAKRCRQQTVGKISVHAGLSDQLAPDLVAALSESELQEVQDWLTVKHEQEQSDMIQWRVKGAAQTLLKIAEALNDERSGEMSKDRAAEIHAGILEVQRALKKAGWPKNKVK